MKKTLYVERSTGECRSGDWVEKLDLEGVERIVVGTGPGSFAGIRSAIAFARGYQLGRPEVEVLGLPSACALARAGERLAVIGDARQGKLWIALLDGFVLEREIFQIEAIELDAGLGSDRKVVSPDHRRIGAMLAEKFREAYLGERLPDAAGLERFDRADPSAAKAEPLPIYLNPAVRS